MRRRRRTARQSVRSGGSRGRSRRGRRRRRTGQLRASRSTSSYSHRVPRLLIELRRGLNDVGFIDLLSPVCGRDFFECDRDRLVSVIQDIHDVFDDCVRESPLLLLGFSGPELHDHVRHCSLLYSSSLTFSIQSTALPLSCSCMAMCVTAVGGAAPGQCFSPCGNQTTSPGPVSSIRPPPRRAPPPPARTVPGL